MHLSYNFFVYFYFILSLYIKCLREEKNEAYQFILKYLNIFFYISVRQYVLLSVGLSVRICPSICQSVFPYVCPSVCPSVCQ